MYWRELIFGVVEGNVIIYSLLTQLAHPIKLSIVASLLCLTSSISFQSERERCQDGLRIRHIGARPPTVTQRTHMVEEMTETQEDA